MRETGFTMAVEVSGWGVGRMGDGPGPGPAVPAGAGDGEATQSFAGGDPVTQSWLADPANPPPRLPTDAVPPRPVTEAVPHRVATEVVRYGPGVPASPSAGQGGLTAERIWRTGHPPAPVGFQNSATGIDLGFYAARSYSLMRPPRMARRLIRCWERSAAAAQRTNPTVFRPAPKSRCRSCGSTARSVD
jgi:hypothetical protein